MAGNTSRLLFLELERLLMKMLFKSLELSAYSWQGMSPSHYIHPGFSFQPGCLPGDHLSLSETGKVNTAFKKQKEHLPCWVTWKCALDVLPVKMTISVFARCMLASCDILGHGRLWAEF